MTALHGMPSGRAGRSWLLQRLATAERGVELLDAKLRVLQREQYRHHLRAERTAAEWARACTAAETWLLRGALLGGRRALRDAVPAAPATVDVTWAVVMGVRYPGGATVVAARPDDGAPTASNTALVQAAAAFRTAVETAAEHAVEDLAVHRIDAEVAATRRRLRAVRDRWIPRLHGALGQVELDLEELEHAEGIRLRWAAAHGPGARGT